MNSGFYKSPWFLTLAGITLWACGYVTADDSRIERENRTAYRRHAAQPGSRHDACSAAFRQETAGRPAP